MDLNQLADQYKKSITRDVFHFENFLIDFFDHHPQRAFENLKKAGGASKDTFYYADQFSHAAFEKLLSKLKDDIKELQVDPRTGKGRLLQEFFRDYFEGCEFEISWDNLQRKISQDPELRSDNEFNVVVQKLGEKVRPRQKERKELGLQEDDGVFIKIRLGLQKRFEQKLTHVELQEILSETLKNFYGAHLANPKEKEALEVRHEVESITRSLKIPLALKLAVEDTTRLSEEINVEMKSLEKRQRTIRDLSFQGVKFGFTDEDLRQAVHTGQPARLEKTGTEKVDIIRDLITDLYKQPLHKAFPAAIKKASGDEALVKLLESHFIMLDKEHTPARQADMLFESYKLYLKSDMTGYKADVIREVEGLSKGVKVEAIRLGLDELEKKTTAIQVTTAMNRFLAKAIHALPQDVLKAYRLDPILQGITKVEQRTGIEININAATAQPNQEGQRQGQTKKFGSHMN